MRKAGLAFLILASASPCLGKYSGGSGTSADPYRIADANDLLTLAADTGDYDKYLILTADINLASLTFTQAPIAPDTNSVLSGFQGTKFTGVFDGNDHKIIDFTINGGSNEYLGLFGRIDSGGSVKNLGLGNCAVSGTSGSEYVGGLVGENYRGSISNCYSTGAVSGSSGVGGLVGRSSGSISNCYSTGAVSGSSRVGGLVGRNESGGSSSISNCYSTGVVSGFVVVGGLVGENFEGDISNCYSTGAVSSSGYYSVGGLVGWNYYGSISNCYSTGTVSGGSGSSKVGGLVGENAYYGSIIDCYSTGAVSGTSYVGGLVGWNWNSSSISNCYSTGAVSGSSYVGGLVGYGSGIVDSSFWDVNTSGQSASAGGTGLTTEQMKTYSYFADAGWDFNDIWAICETTNYPKLIWQILPSDIVCPDGVDIEDLAEMCEEWLFEEIPADMAPPPSGDGIVDFADFSIFANQWGITNGIDELLDFTGQWLKMGLLICSADISPLPDGDGRVDAEDFAIMANDWLEGF